MIKRRKTYSFTVVIEKDEDGYFAYCPELQGCYTQGETFEEVMENARDAVKLHIEDRLANNEDIHSSEVVTVSTVKVAV
ncbi:MAG: type II toxin-antitoxin system HicB family antitoxin [Chloroflexi bacterium]|nr:type II toxin-antitoxin system HicB family antitoxin [Chloroflexota bacterium]